MIFFQRHRLSAYFPFDSKVPIFTFLRVCVCFLAVFFFQVQRSLGDFEQAVDYHYRQLVTAKTMGDLERQSQAMCDLGEVYQEMGRHEDAVTYHRRDLELSEQLQNIEGQVGLKDRRTSMNMDLRSGDI